MFAIQKQKQKRYNLKATHETVLGALQSLTLLKILRNYS